METAAFEVQGFSRFTDPLFTRTEGPEVFGSMGGVGHQVDFNSTCLLTTNADIEVNLGVRHNNIYILEFANGIAF